MALNNKTKIFKIFTLDEWQEFEQKNEFHGSDHDQKDGFIHMAYEDQLNHVIDSYFKHKKVVIASFWEHDLKNYLKIENGFPHLYFKALFIGEVIDFRYI